MEPLKTSTQCDLAAKTESTDCVEFVPGYWVAWRKDYSAVACCANKNDVLAAVAAEGLALDDVIVVQLAWESDAADSLGGQEFGFIGQDH